MRVIFQVPLPFPEVHERGDTNDWVRLHNRRLRQSMRVHCRKENGNPWTFWERRVGDFSIHWNPSLVQRTTNADAILASEYACRPLLAMLWGHMRRTNENLSARTAFEVKKMWIFWIFWELGVECFAQSTQPTCIFTFRDVHSWCKTDASSLSRHWRRRLFLAFC